MSGYPDSVRETAWAARQFLADRLPQAQESIDEAARLIGFRCGPGYKGVVCTLIMSQAGVKLGIVRGVELPDPKHLMTGAGKVHRHVQLRSVADLKRPGLSKPLKDTLAAWRKRNGADASVAVEQTAMHKVPGPVAVVPGITGGVRATHVQR